MTLPSTRKRNQTIYPEPLIIPPLSDHKQTFIVLHGRGSNAAAFGPALLNTKISDSRTFHQAFPHARFIFPTASKRRAQIYHRSVINQWFDNWSLQTPNERSELQIEGLRETSAYIHSLLKHAIDDVGAKNVVLGGLSQGCAAAMIALLLWNGDSLAAGFGMCGWLPFQKQMMDVLHPSVVAGNDHDDDGLFGAPEAAVDVDMPTQMVAFLREELECLGSQSSMAFQRTPLFLGHGINDEKVPVELGREAVSCLESLGANVEWHEYQKLEHWYSKEMLGDSVKLLRQIGLEGEADRTSPVIDQWQKTMDVDSRNS